MHKDELWQVYAPNGEPIVGEGWDSALDNPEATGSDAIVGVAVVFLYRLPFAETEEFRTQFAKAPLKKDALTFECLKEWFLQHGDL